MALTIVGDNARDELIAHVFYFFQNWIAFLAWGNTDDIDSCKGEDEGGRCMCEREGGRPELTGQRRDEEDGLSIQEKVLDKEAKADIAWTYLHWGYATGEG